MSTTTLKGQYSKDGADIRALIESVHKAQVSTRPITTKMPLLRCTVRARRSGYLVSCRRLPIEATK